jgi:hypothetical protein
MNNTETKTAEKYPFFNSLCDLCMESGPEGKGLTAAIMDFTVEEINLVAIYKADTKASTLASISAALPYMDRETRSVANNAKRLLSRLTEQEFSATPFTPADDTEG